MKTNTILCLLVLITLLGIACNSHDSSQQTTGQTTNQDTLGNVPNRPAPEHSKADSTHLPPPGQRDTAAFDTKAGDFATEAAEGGLMEVAAGQLAQQQGMSQRVKDFGAMMVADHTKANDELKTIATAKHFALSAILPEKHQHMVDDLRKKQGKDFDYAYIKMMVSDHQKDIRAFEKASKTIIDTTLKFYADRTLPVLHKHLDSAQAIYRSY